MASSLAHRRRLVWVVGGHGSRRLAGVVGGRLGLGVLDDIVISDVGNF